MNIFIADDERNIRENIKEFIPWEKTEISKIVTAKNGIEALELMAVDQPDILLSDIRMPKMNGIELANEVHKLYPRCIIIFLSGYADKEYLKSAIDLQAISYVEKPLDINQILEILLKAQNMHIQRETQNLNFLNFQKYINDSQPGIRQEWVRKFYRHKGDVSKIEHAEPLLIDDFLANDSYQSIIIKLSWDPGLETAHIKGLQEQILFKFNEVKWNNLLICGFISDDYLLIISRRSLSEDDQNDIKSIICDILPEYSCSLSIAVGSPLPSLSESFGEIDTLRKISWLQFYDRQWLHLINAETFNPLNVSPELISSLIISFDSIDSESTAEKIEKLKREIKHFKDPDMTRLQDFYNSIYEKCLGGLKMKESGKYATLLASELCKIDIPHHDDDFEIYHNRFEEMVLSALGKVEDFEQNGSRGTKIMNYINSNYSNNNLSVDLLAEEFGLSPTYLCSIFKKATDKTLHQYITDVRIEKAKDLLMKSNDKIYEIAKNVGFLDTNYFSTIFKKYTGVTPLKYRK